jgi:hypothetical protein
MEIEKEKRHLGPQSYLILISLLEIEKEAFKHDVQRRA